MPQQILAATTLSKIDPLTLDFRFNGIYRLKDRVCKNNTILNWIILDSIDQFRYGHKFVLPITSVLYHTSLPNRKSQRADARETAARHLRGAKGKEEKKGKRQFLIHQSPSSAIIAVERLSSGPRSSFPTSGETPLPLLGEASPFKDAASTLACFKGRGSQFGIVSA